MNSIELLEQRIAEVTAASRVPEDAVHSRNTLWWLLELDPEADLALQIAALGHDIDRAVEERKTRREDFPDYDAFKDAHARNGAEILSEMMQACGVEDAALLREVRRLVRRHEVGGDPRSDLLADADSLSFFDVNLPLYRERNGHQETRRRCIWGYRRLSPGARAIVAHLRHRSEDLERLVAESIELAERTSGAVSRLGSGSDPPATAAPGERRERGPACTTSS